MSYTATHVLRQRNWLLELFKGIRRDDLPEPLRTYFYEEVECKYPTKSQLVTAMDHFLHCESLTPSATLPADTPSGSTILRQKPLQFAAP